MVDWLHKPGVLKLLDIHPLQDFFCFFRPAATWNISKWTACFSHLHLSNWLFCHKRLQMFDTFICYLSLSISMAFFLWNCLVSLFLLNNVDYRKKNVQIKFVHFNFIHWFLKSIYFLCSLFRDCWHKLKNQVNFRHF